VVISTSDENGLIIHVVGYGQTLWSIAATYDVPIDEIRQLNGMAGDATIISVGQKLLIRKANGVGLAGTKEMSTNTPVKTKTPETWRITPSITTTRPGVAIDLPPEKRGFGIIIGIMTSIVGAIIIIGLSSRIRWKKSKKNKKNLEKAL
jgi:LysM repeat protein